MDQSKQIRVSYLITTRNRAQFLQKTLDNVREFITPEDELIVIDGGSTDETVEILERNRDIVSFYLSEPDKGEAHAFNKGVFRAKGRFIKPITDDDYFYPEAMRELIQTMEENPNIEALIAGGEQYRVVDGDEVCESIWNLPPGIPINTYEGFSRVSCGLGIIFQRRLYEIIGGVSNSYTSVDGDLICKIIECGCNYKYIDVCLYRWFCHQHSGFNKSQQILKDYDMFLIRFGNCSTQKILETFIKKCGRGEYWNLEKTNRAQSYAIKILLLTFQKQHKALSFILSLFLFLLHKLSELWNLIIKQNPLIKNKPIYLGPEKISYKKNINWSGKVF